MSAATQVKPMSHNCIGYVVAYSVDGYEYIHVSKLDFNSYPDGRGIEIVRLGILMS